MSEPDWRDKKASKQWLEERYVGSAEAGSPLLQHCMVKGRNTRRLEDHLSPHELLRWLQANKTTGAIHYGPQSTDYIFYNEYGPSESLGNSQLHSPTPERATKSKATVRGTAQKVKRSQELPKPGAKVRKSRSSKQQRSPKPTKRPKESEKRFEPDAMLAIASRLRSLRPRRETRRSKSGRLPQVFNSYKVSLI